MNKYTIKKSTRYSVNEYTCLQKMFRRHLDVEFLFRELRLTVNECIFVFCAEVFLLLVGFFGTLYITYTLYRKQSFFFFFAALRVTTSLCCRVFSLPPLHLFFACSSLHPQSNTTRKQNQRPLFLKSTSIVRPVQLRNPHLSGPVITHHAFVVHFGQRFAML